MGTDTMASGWRAIPLGPWERYRLDLDGGRRVIVAPGVSGGWVWEIWSVLDSPLYLRLGESATAREAIDDADRASTEYAALTDEELTTRNGIDAYAEVVTLTVVTIGGGRRCIMCEREIAPGLAAEQAGDGWLWCPSCACRNPGSVMAVTA